MDFLCCKVFDRAVVIILVSLLRGVVDGMRKILFASIMAVFFLSGCISLFSPWNWTVKVRGSFQFSSPVAGQNGKIYAATSEDLYAFTGTGTASVVYSIGAGEWFSCDPSIDENGDIYIGTTGGRLLKISPTGNLIWSFPDQQRQDDWTVRGDPSFDNAGNVYYGDANGTLYCLTPDGTELWSFDTGKEIWSKPAIDNDGTAYFGTLVTGSNEKHRLYGLKMVSLFGVSKRLDRPQVFTQVRLLAMVVTFMRPVMTVICILSILKTGLLTGVCRSLQPLPGAIVESLQALLSPPMGRYTFAQMRETFTPFLRAERFSGPGHLRQPSSLHRLSLLRASYIWSTGTRRGFLS